MGELSNHQLGHYCCVPLFPWDRSDVRGRTAGPSLRLIFCQFLQIYLKRVTVLPSSSLAFMLVSKNPHRLLWRFLLIWQMRVVQTLRSEAHSPLQFSSVGSRGLIQTPKKIKYAPSLWCWLVYSQNNPPGHSEFFNMCFQCALLNTPQQEKPNLKCFF